MSDVCGKLFEVVFLCKHLRETKMSLSNTTKYMNKSKSFVKKKLMRCEQTKTVNVLQKTLLGDKMIVKNP